MRDNAETADQTPPVTSDITGPDSLVAPNFLHDAPHLYEAYVADVGHGLIDALATYLHQHRCTTVLDVGCGPGTEVARLRSAGFAADGVDASARMVTRARARCPSAHFEQALMGDLRVEKLYDAIICLGSTFLYNTTAAEIRQALGEFARHLVDGGLLILEMRNGAYYLTGAGQATLAEPPSTRIPVGGEAVLTCTSRLSVDLERQLLRRAYRWQHSHDGTDHTEVLHHRLLFPAELREHLDAAGFAVGWMGCEPDRLGAAAPLTGPRLILVARRTSGAGEQV